MLRSTSSQEEKIAVRNELFEDIKPVSRYLEALVTRTCVLIDAISDGVGDTSKDEEALDAILASIEIANKAMIEATNAADAILVEEGTYAKSND